VTYTPAALPCVQMEPRRAPQQQPRPPQSRQRQRLQS
jgi:hypothetical protein